MGCAKVSPGCANCYMFREQRQYGNDPLLVRRSKTRFNDPVALSKAGRKWEAPQFIFTCSWSDWFIPAADEWREEAWEVVRASPQHVFLILTKRPELVADRVPADWPLPNVWLGVSIENARHTFRADQLREIPAERRFISAEPLLGTLLGRASHGNAASAERMGPDGGRAPSVEALPGRAPLDLSGIDWLIVGGESGGKDNARPMHPTWARELRDAALSASVAFHFKQWGSYAPYAGGDEVLSLDGRRASYADLSDSLIEPVKVRYCGPKPESGGRLLDGVEFLDRPEQRPVDVPLVTLF